MAKIPHGIQAQHVLQAIRALEDGVDHDFGESRDYDLLHDSRRYPPKAVVGIAAGFATGQQVHHSEFSSGIGAGQACRVLHDLGFVIVDKSSTADVFSKPRFVPGQVYRRKDLHKQYGGQEQGGISTPKDHAVVFLISGASGSQYGYTDGFRDDGMYWYTGEGQVGDMEMKRGNAAVRDHKQSGKALHVFSDVGDATLQYVGEAEYVDHHKQVAPDRDGKPRQAIVFELSIGGGAAGAEAPRVHKPRPKEQTGLWNEPFRSLRDLALKDAPQNAPLRERKATVRRRSEAVRVYVLRRADGRCEGCGRPAPFETPEGKAYLEPHHTRRLADGGPDHPRWVAALCPNCHARVHYAADGGAFNAGLIERLGELEAKAGFGPG